MLYYKNILSPKRISQKGKPYGGQPFSRGALYALLKNPAYIGKISHKGKIHDGLHEGIVEQEVWQTVQEKLKDNAVSRSEIAQNKHLLQGLIYDLNGTIYSPIYTKRHGRQYRYYVSQNLLQYKDHPNGILARLPAHEIEALVEKTLLQEIPRFCDGLDANIQDHISSQHNNIPGYDLIRLCLKKVTIGLEEIILQIQPGPFVELSSKYLNLNISGLAENYDVSVPFKLKKAQRGALVMEPEGEKDIFDLPPSNLKKLVQGTIWRDEHFDGMALKDIAKREGCSEAYVGTAIYQSLDFGT